LVLIDSYDDTTPGSQVAIGADHPSAGTLFSARCQSFRPSVAYTLTSCKFRLDRIGLPTGEIKARLYVHSGTFGSGATPGAELAVSNAVDPSDIPTSHDLVEFTFSGDEQYDMLVDTAYFIGIEATEFNVDTSNYIRLAGATSSQHEGNPARYRQSAWASHVWDYCFYVYGNLTAAYPSQRALKFMPIHGWESVAEEYLKGEISSTGVLSTS